MTHRRPLASVAIAAIAAVIITGAFVLGDTPARAAAHQASIAGAAFSPATLTISAGDTVTWQNNDSILHTASSDAGVSPAFDTGTISGGATAAAVTFNQAGTYGYHCTIHGTATTGMRGSVVVQADSPGM